MPPTNYSTLPSVEELTNMIFRGGNYFHSQIENFKPKIAIVLGSGLKKLTADLVNDPIVIPYRTINQSLPFWPLSTAPGHKDGAFWVGRLAGNDVIIFQGRVHPYDGLPMWQLSIPYRIMAEIGIDTLLLTNATGGTNPNVVAKGDIMIASDLTFLFGPPSPMIGQKLPKEERFQPLSPCFDPDLIKMMEKTAVKNGILTRRGVYAQISGPHYETLQDGLIFYQNNVHAVGMSIGHETLTARHRGMRVAAICMITDMVPPFAPPGEVANEQIVLENTRLMEDKVNTIIKGMVEQL